MTEMEQPKKVAGRYLKQEVLGQGTYGVVFKAIETQTGNTVAIKKIRIGPQKEGVNSMALREIKILKELKHPNIILMIEAFPHKENLHLVFEFMETDLEAVIHDSHIFLSPADIKSYLLMTFKGLAFCHEKSILHRDMKPNNLLIGVDGQLKLADFGLARIFGSPNKKLTNQVFTRWYRAPELLFGAKQYGPEVDVWAAGCIFAELLLRRPFLQGKSDIDQLSKIFAAFGTPKVDQWPDLPNLPDYVEYQFVPAPSLNSLFPAVSEDALDLLSKMFTYDPKARISIKQALEHRYFTSEPPPTDPGKLPKPVRKQDRKSSYSKHKAITGLSPPHKLRRVMLEHGKVDSLKSHGTVDSMKSHGTVDSMKSHGTVDMDQPTPNSLDFSILAEQPPNRPKITSADRAQLKRKLFEFD